MKRRNTTVQSEGSAPPLSNSWNLCSRLILEAQAKDVKAAQVTFQALFAVLAHESEDRGFDALKLRTLQVLTNVNRAIYSSGVRTRQLLHLNIDLINRMIRVKTRRGLLKLAQNMLQQVISLIPERDDYGSHKINVALDYIRQHAQEKISREEIAELLDCSPSHVSRIFLRILGRSFKDVVLQHRMERAKEVIKTSMGTITEVAYEMGYDDPNYFSATFKRVTGITPRQYRRRIAETSG